MVLKVIMHHLLLSTINVPHAFYYLSENLMFIKHYLIVNELVWDCLPSTQWAAVTTHCGAIRDPPHIGTLLKSMRTCHGQAPCLAFSPAITLPCWTSGFPQSAKSGSPPLPANKVKDVLEHLFFNTELQNNK